METLHIAYAAQIARTTLLGFRRRVRPVIMVALLALALMLSVAGTASQVSAAPRKAKPQPEVYCEYFSREGTIHDFGFDPGPGGYWDCYFVNEATQAH